VNVYGDYETAAAVKPSELDTGNVILMDCEGAEESILAGLCEYPSVAIVETHPEHVPTQTVHDMLSSAGYSVSQREYQPDKGHPNKRVLVGQLGDQSSGANNGGSLDE
jgi:hypothetical protein